MNQTVIDIQGITTVSYTHLDVYKRQPYDPHDFDMKEFIKWNVEDYFNFDGDSFQLDACRREYPRPSYHMFMVCLLYTSRCV